MLARVWEMDGFSATHSTVCMVKGLPPPPTAPLFAPDDWGNLPPELTPCPKNKMAGVLITHLASVGLLIVHRRAKL
jgi:hypothetical protein